MVLNCMCWIVAEMESSVSVSQQSSDMNISFVSCLVKRPQSALCCCVWPLCRPDADGSRSFSIRLFVIKNLDEPQDLQCWESLVFTVRHASPTVSERKANLFIHRNRDREFWRIIWPLRGWMDTCQTLNERRHNIPNWALSSKILLKYY